MGTIDVRRFALAWGATAALLYAGCVIVMSTVSRDAQILFFNSLLHGIDVTTILRASMPVWEMLIGLVETFILAWLVGASIAAVYNSVAQPADRSPGRR
jgi:hypothetical protein